MQNHILSKSTYIRGLKCAKSLYLNKHKKHLRDELSPMQKAIFNQGNLVGELAQKLFPKGVDCTSQTFYNFNDALLKTKKAIEDNVNVIYEAAFQHNGVLAILDILVKDKQGWKAYEVKSGTSISSTYIKDAAVQSYVIENCQIKLEDFFIVHINNKYIRKENLELDKLFTITSVNEKIKQLTNEVPENIAKQKAILEKTKAPEIKIGPHCTAPYTCDFMGNCWKEIPEYSIFDVSNLNQDKKFDLFNSGTTLISEIPEKFPLSKNQSIQVSCEINQGEIIAKDQLNLFLAELSYPLYFLDFETFSSAVPIFKDSKPYQQIVFQYSLHIQEKEDEAPRHYEYLAQSEKTDPRKNFAKSLVEHCKGNGSIIVYNKSFESSVIRQLAKLFPEYNTELLQINERIKDLMIPFQKKWYYNYKMKGSYSIKAVLPAMINELSYEDLTIKDGGIASHTFAQMINGSFEGNTEKARENLLAYCKLDTLAMVEILNKLKVLAL